MEHDFIKPKIMISRCVEFEPCRWNGDMIHSFYIQRLKSFAEFIPVCPEFDIGLGVPRNPVRLIKKGKNLHLIQSVTEADFTEKMKQYAQKVCEENCDADALILKEKSPSCGTGNVKIYPGPGKVSPLSGDGIGIFADIALKFFPSIPVIHEGKFNDLKWREHFYIQIFTLASFRKLSKAPDVRSVMAFQERNKLLFMAYHQRLMREMGRLAAGMNSTNFQKSFAEYEKYLRELLCRPPKPVSHINVLMHALGYFSDRLHTLEKQFFLNSLEMFREERIDLSSCLAVMHSWILRFNQPYLKNQSYFQPFPIELLNVRDSAKAKLRL